VHCLYSQEEHTDAYTVIRRNNWPKEKELQEDSHRVEMPDADHEIPVQDVSNLVSFILKTCNCYFIVHPTLATNCFTRALKAADGAVRLPGSSHAETALPGSVNAIVCLDVRIIKTLVYKRNLG